MKHCPKICHLKQDLSQCHILGQKEEAEEKLLEKEQYALALCIIHRLQAFHCLTKLWTSHQNGSSKFHSISVAELAAGQSSPYSQIIWVLFVSPVIWIRGKITIHVNLLISSYATVMHLSPVAQFFLSFPLWWYCSNIVLSLQIFYHGLFKKEKPNQKNTQTPTASYLSTLYYD